MPVKRSAMKRKNTSSQEKIPSKVSRKSVNQVPEQKLHIDEPIVERQKPGVVLTMGQGDVGQLGLGPDIQERMRPALVPGLSDVVDIVSGGMHTVCLTEAGKVFTFGCNDEGALGRTTTEEGSETSPGEVQLDGRVVQVSAGDSHTAALLEDGRVFAWGAFRDSHGTMGLTPDGQVVPKPFLMDIKEKSKKIASGTDHLLILTQHGQLFSCGCGEQGQLGRLGERIANREGRQGLTQLLVPTRVTFNIKKKLELENIWAGQYCSYVKENKKGSIYVFGLNNYKQLGIDNINTHFHPTLLKSFEGKSWSKISGGQHHTLALDSDGKVYSLGRRDYGRLGLGPQVPGLGEQAADVGIPTEVPGLKNKKCVDISCGTCVSFAVTEDGHVYSWGMGSNGQLGTGDEEDRYEPHKVEGKQLEQRRVQLVSSGGQHTVLLAISNTS